MPPGVPQRGSRATNGERGAQRPPPSPQPPLLAYADLEQLRHRLSRQREHRAACPAEAHQHVAHFEPRARHSDRAPRIRRGDEIIAMRTMSCRGITGLPGRFHESVLRHCDTSGCRMCGVVLLPPSTPAVRRWLGQPRSHPPERADTPPARCQGPRRLTGTYGGVGRKFQRPTGWSALHRRGRAPWGHRDGENAAGEPCRNDLVTARDHRRGRDRPRGISRLR
jgi:hypothetical protein